MQDGGGPGGGGGGRFDPLATTSLLGTGGGNGSEEEGLGGGVAGDGLTFADIGGAGGGAVDGGVAWLRGKRGGIRGLLLGEVEGGLGEELPWFDK